MIQNFNKESWKSQSVDIPFTLHKFQEKNLNLNRDSNLDIQISSLALCHWAILVLIPINLQTLLLKCLPLLQDCMIHEIKVYMIEFITAVPFLVIWLISTGRMIPSTQRILRNAPLLTRDSILIWEHCTRDLVNTM